MKQSSLELCVKIHDFWEDIGQFYLIFPLFIDFISNILWILFLISPRKCWQWTGTKSGYDLQNKNLLNLKQLFRFVWELAQEQPTDCTEVLTIFFLLFWPCLQHTEVLRAGMGSMPQQWLEPQQWQFQILNPLCHQGPQAGQSSVKGYLNLYTTSQNWI